MPVKAKAHLRHIQQGTDKLPVVLRAKFLHEFPPGLGDVHTALVVENIAIVAGLIVLALLTQRAAKLLHVGHGIEQHLELFPTDKVLRIDPGIGFLSLKSLWFNTSQYIQIEIHRRLSQVSVGR